MIPIHTSRTFRIQRTVLWVALAFAALFAFPPFLRAGEQANEKTGEDSSPAPSHEKWWEWWFPGYYKPSSLYPRRLSRPLLLGNNNFLHHLVLIPPMESFRVVEHDHFGLDFRIEGARLSKTGKHGEANRFDASYFESVARLSYGLSKNFEFRAGFNVAWFHPDNEDSVRLTQGGEAVLPPDDFDPRPNVGDILLGLKILSAFEPKQHLGFSTVLSLKIPVGKNDFLTSGRGDFSLTFCGTARFGLGDGYHLFGHLTAGVAFFDEENVFPKKVYLSSCSIYGVSVVFPLKADQSFVGLPFALILQIQGHTNVFRKLDILNSDPMNMHAGLRVMMDTWAFEVSGGFGLSRTGVPDFVVDVALGSDF